MAHLQEVRAPALLWNPALNPALSDELSYLPTPSPTPSISYHFPQEDPPDQSALRHSYSPPATGPADEEQLEAGGTSTRKRKKRRRTEGTAPPPIPAERCKRGGTKVAKHSSRSDRPQKNHYQSDEEVRGEEPLEQNFLPAQNVSAEADSHPEKQCLPERAAHFVLAVSLACRDVIANANSEASCSVFQLFQSLQGLAPNELQSEDDSLQNLALRCIRAEQVVSSVDFVYMLNCIQLRCKVVRQVAVLLLQSEAALVNSSPAFAFRPKKDRLLYSPVLKHRGHLALLAATCWTAPNTVCWLEEVSKPTTLMNISKN
jgi:hypothetical protein